MNAISVNPLFEAMDDDSAQRAFEPIQRKQRRPDARRKGNGGSGGGIHCRRNKSHTWGSGAAARMADLRAFAGGLAVLLAAFGSPASADVFGGAGTLPASSAISPITGLGKLTHDVKAESLGKTGEAMASVDLARDYDPFSRTWSIDVATGTAEADEVTDTWIASDRTSGWYAAESADRATTELDSLSATELVDVSNAPSQWPIASTEALAMAATRDGAPASSDGAPEVFGDYVNTYSTYGVWDTVASADTAAPAASDTWVALGVSAGSNVPMVGGEFLLSAIDRSSDLRVAVVAVPEPSNVVAVATALAFGITTMFFRRRKLGVARVAAC